MIEDSKSMMAVAVGVGTIAALGLVAFFLSQGERTKLAAIVDPPEIRVVQLRERIALAKAKLEKAASPEESAKILRVLYNLESTLVSETAKIEKRASESQRARELRASQEKTRKLDLKKLKESSWGKLGKPALLGEATSKLPWQLEEEARTETAQAEASARHQKTRQKKQAAAESERRQLKAWREQEDARLRPERLADLRRQEEELAPDQISRAVLREHCRMYVSPGALPRDIQDFYSGRELCGTRSFHTEDGRQGFIVRSLHGGHDGQKLNTERWSKQDDDSWALDDSRHQGIEMPKVNVSVPSPLFAPPSPEKLNEWERKALKTIDDPNFTYSDADPDAKKWDAAFESLRVRGFMNIVPNPANLNDSLFVMTSKGREALAGLS
jgi:hypothetical protein